MAPDRENAQYHSAARGVRIAALRENLPQNTYSMNFSIFSGRPCT
jgi:hypothetical protein